MACLISNFTCFVLSDFPTDFMLYSGRPVYQLYIDISPFNSLLAIKTYFCVHRIFFHRNLHEYIHLPFMLEMVLKRYFKFYEIVYYCCFRFWEHLVSWRQLLPFGRIDSSIGTRKTDQRI